MTVSADLATLREWITDTSYAKPGTLEHAALARVEAELSRLREQITELLQQESFMERKMAAQREDIERLAARVEAAVAECARLQQALREIAGFGASIPAPGWSAVVSADVVKVAREALAGLDTPADSQEDIDGETWGLMQGGEPT